MKCVAYGDRGEQNTTTAAAAAAATSVELAATAIATATASSPSSKIEQNNKYIKYKITKYARPMLVHAQPSLNVSKLSSHHSLWIMWLCLLVEILHCVYLYI